MAPSSRGNQIILKRELHKAADAYDDLGWNLVVVSGKNPIGKWSDPWPIHKVHDAIDSPSATGLALALGERFGGLAVREFRSRRTYHKWTSDEAGLAKTLPTIATTRGIRVICLIPGQRAARVLLPPSECPDGPCKWLVEPGHDLPLLSREDLHLPPRATQNPDICTRLDLSYSCAIEESSDICTTEEASDSCASPEGRTDHSGLAETSEEGTSSAKACLHPIEALRRCTNTVENVNANDAYIAKRLQVVMGIAATDTYRTGMGNTAVDLVARVFRAESAMHGGQPFAFSCRALGQACNMGTMTAQRLAKQLADAKLVTIVSPGKRWSVGADGKIVKSGISTVWQWTGPPPTC
jgi:hypothetical protein